MDIAAVEVGGDVEAAKRIRGSRSSVKLIPRMTVTVESPSEVVRSVRRTPRGVLVSVKPLTIEAARRAATSKRVHLIRIPLGMARIIDRSTARLFRDKGYGAIEIPLSEVLRNLEYGWRHLVISVRRAIAYRVNLVLVSDASSKWDLWDPRVAASLMSIIGVPWHVALSWVSNTPRSIAKLVLST